MVSHGSRLRRYTTKNGVRCLSTWIQERCKSCGKFLGKHQQEYCSKHNTPKEKATRYYYSNSENRGEKILRSKIERSPDRFNVGDIV